MGLLTVPGHDLLWSLDGLLWCQDEGRRLAYLASRVPRSLAIVEIGSLRGKSTCFLAAGTREGLGAPVYAVDLWDLEPLHPPGIWEEFRGQIQEAGLDGCITPIKGESSQVASDWNAPIGLLFIDGDHDSESVRTDLGAWGPLLVQGGVIAVHDYHPQFPGVMDAVDELIRSSPEWTEIRRHGESLVSAVRTGR